MKEETIFTVEAWNVIKGFALQHNRLNAEKNFVTNEQRRLETEKPRSWKKEYESLNMKYQQAHFAMNQIDKTIDYVSRQMAFVPVDVYNEMERHWQNDLLDEEKRGYKTF